VSQPQPAAFSGTVSVDNPEKNIEKKANGAAATTVKDNTEDVAALKLSIN
jgi:hypothetical protein